MSVKFRHKIDYFYIQTQRGQEEVKKFPGAIGATKKTFILVSAFIKKTRNFFPKHYISKVLVFIVF